ncbi:MAG: ABC transporter substrate-binding protein [Chloroflexota bacterium]
MSKQKLTRREMLKVSALFGVGAVAAACVPAEGGTGAAASVDSGDDGGVEGAFWVLQGKDFHDGYNDYVRAQIVGYAEEQGWDLDISFVAGFTSGSGAAEKVAASVQAGNPPDLIIHTFGSVQMHSTLDAIVEVDDIMEDVEAMWGKAAPFMYIEHNLDGNWWMVPYHQRSGGGYYRRDVFDAAGIDLQAIRQYPELREACLEASNPDEEIFGWGITVNRSGDGNSIINRVKTGFGAAWQDETGQFVATNSPEMIDAMNFIKETYLDEKYQPMLPPGVLAWNDISNNEAYLGQKLGYTENAGTVYAKAVADGNPVAELTNYLKPPGGPAIQEFQTVPAKTWQIQKGAKNDAAARQTIRHFMLDLGRMDEMLESSPAYAIPAYTDLWDQSEYIQTSEIALQQKNSSLDASGINATIYPGPNTPAMSAINEAGIWNDMVNSIVTETASVEDAVAEAHDRMVGIFQEFGLPGTEG